MVRQLLAAVARSEIDGLRRRVAVAGLGLVAVLLVALALLFLLVALFLWLSTEVEPWQAALIVAGVLSVLALLVWAVGLAAGRKASRARSRNSAQMQAAIDEASRAMKSDQLPTLAVGAALAAGFIFGRRIFR